MKPVAPVTFNNAWAVVLLRALDLFFAMAIWREYDITISAWCGLELRKPKPRLWARILGPALNRVERDHCEIAIAADRTRALAALEILGPAQ